MTHPLSRAVLDLLHAVDNYAAHCHTPKQDRVPADKKAARQNMLLAKTQVDRLKYTSNEPITIDPKNL